MKKWGANNGKINLTNTAKIIEAYFDASPTWQWRELKGRAVMLASIKNTCPKCESKDLN